MTGTPKRRFCINCGDRFVDDSRRTLMAIFFCEACDDGLTNRDKSCWICWAEKRGLQGLDDRPADGQLDENWPEGFPVRKPLTVSGNAG